MYLNTDFSHVKIFFQNIVLKTAWLCDVRLQNYSAINCVLFWTTMYIVFFIDVYFLVFFSIR